MKTKRVVVGAMAIAMLSMGVSSLPSVIAANDSVQISVGNAVVPSGEEFSLNVMISNIPSTGIKGCDFALSYDNSLITVNSISAGTLTDTGAATADPSASLLPVFNYDIQNDAGYIGLLWSTSLEDSSYWMSGEGVFCTITGTVSSSAASGTETEIKVIPADRETYPDSGVKNTSITVGYSNGSSSEKIKYGVETTAGLVKIGAQVTMRGDANCDGEVDMGDAVAILKYCADQVGCALSDVGMANADVENTGDSVDPQDALRIQKWRAKQISEL